ncbi:splicing factor, suppressor of white-apricot homolog [Ctenocephalides felis]|uniref:splicing factor, suppressor of white-apricot homolog n=1 Tax=Ctenocephalides felis TaxID=7515 RepID=UPI000E6E46D4|nr:splicing factor, suppressor of white-apricot homolog [Ctenocephalides felis]
MLVHTTRLKPPNKKLAIILERTANFIAQQGGQMEILLKAKQQHNPQFEFLNHDNELFAFYRHVLMAIKTGRYKYTEAPEKPEKESTQHSEDEASYYLHPSLASNISKVDSAPALPSIPTHQYTTETTPEAEKESNVNVELDKQPEKVESNDTNTNASSEDYVNQWNQYYNSEQYQEYYRHYYYATYGIDPLSLDYNNAIQKPPVMYLQSNPPMPPDNPPENTEKAAVPSVAEPVVENEPVKAPKPKLQIGALAHYYNTDSDNSDSEIEVENLVPIPPDAEKLIIVKMAIYVAKNGKEFEEIVKAKKDPRFNFLTPTHQYHTFYKTKLNAQLISMGKIINNGCENSSEDVEKKDDETPEEQQQQKPKIIAAPVSFTIKKPKEPEQIITKPALPLEDSDEDEEQTKNISKIESSSYVANNETNVVETIKECTNTAKVKQENNRESIETKISSIDDKKDEEKVNSPSSETNIVDDEMVISSDPELSNASTPELVKNETNGDLTEDQCIENQDKKFHSEMKAVENECIDLTNDSVKPNCDDEVTILRENGLIDESSGNNVKKLQLERKKRAMEFLNHLKSEDPKESVHRKSRKHSSDKKESSRRHKSSKRSRKRSDSASDESPPKMKKSKKKSRSHSRSSRTHKHRKHSKSNHHEDE